MSSLTTIRNILSADRHGEDAASVDMDAADKPSLASAMKAVDTMIERSDQTRAQVENEAAAAKPNSDANFEPIADAAEMRPENLAAKIEQSSEAETERRLCLHRKQKTLDEMREHIQQSASLLGEVAKKSDQLVAYFVKSEIDLSHFEATEARSTKAQELITAISVRHKEMKLSLSNQQQQIDLLQGLKAKNRSTIERAVGEINRLNADVVDLQSNNKTMGFEVEKLKDDKNALTEQVEQLCLVKRESAKQISDLQANLEAFQLQAREQERLIAGQTEMIQSLTHERDAGVVEVKDLQTQLKNLHVKLTELQAALGEANHENQAAANDYEQKLRLRDSRILKLETENQTITNQLNKTEEKLADLAHKEKNRKTLRVVPEARTPEAISVAKASREAVAASLN